MPEANARLHVAFDFDLTVPEPLVQADIDALRTALAEALGATVLKGMPTVTAKQLGKAGIALLAQRHRIEVESLATPKLPREAVIAAAPHLSDDEVDALCRQATGKVAAGAEMQRQLRRLALKVASDYRLVPCRVSAERSDGGRVEMNAELNLTNGGVLVDDAWRKTRLRNDQPPLTVRVDDSEVRLCARLGGHTLGGPLIEVEVAALVPHRDALIARWRSACGAT